MDAPEALQTNQQIDAQMSDEILFPYLSGYSENSSWQLDTCIPRSQITNTLAGSVPR